ncbi:MAG: hypothetical protein EOP05_00255 [Proteobacteria bacterium]|nr:MAG: hypothetical protein EOP05_00255 [Pseudomonadota bacterium]
MNRSQLWGFEVAHIVASIVVLTITNVLLNFLNGTLILSWVTGLATLGILRVVSHGQKTGHLELLLRFTTSPHIYLGHRGRPQPERTKS